MDAWVYDFKEQEFMELLYDELDAKHVSIEDTIDIREDSIRYSFSFISYDAQKLEDFEWLGSFYQVKNQWEVNENERE